MLQFYHCVATHGTSILTLRLRVKSVFQIPEASLFRTDSQRISPFSRSAVRLPKSASAWNHNRIFEVRQNLAFIQAKSTSMDSAHAGAKQENFESIPPELNCAELALLAQRKSVGEKMHF